MPVEDFIIYVYCCVADIYPELCKSPIRSRGFQPKLTDSGKKIQGRKRHILVETLGLIMGVVATAASVQERNGAKLLFKAFTGSCKKIRRTWV